MRWDPDKLSMIRRERRLTQLALAVRMGVTPGTISRWELGVKTPTIANIGRMAEALEVHPAQLLGMD